MPQTAEEVGESVPDYFRNLPPNIKKKIRERKCENCKKVLDNMPMSYVVASNGRVVWWHKEKCYLIIKKNG